LLFCSFDCRKKIFRKKKTQEKSETRKVGNKKNKKTHFPQPEQAHTTTANRSQSVQYQSTNHKQKKGRAKKSVSCSLLSLNNWFQQGLTQFFDQQKQENMEKEKKKKEEEEKKRKKRAKTT
jgi:hypothetical protein